jgi:hypothetical protein
MLNILATTDHPQILLLLSLLILKLKIKHARLKQFYDYYIEAICFAGKNRFQPERRGG